MEANNLLEDSLKKFAERFRAMAPKHFAELRPIGNVIRALSAPDSLNEGAFVKNLVNLSEAVIEVRKNPASPPSFRELPIPPYDLWLPFKAHGAALEPKDLNKANDVFSKQVGELASTWELVEAMHENSLESFAQRSSEPELESLRNGIMNLYEYCNKRCSIVTKAPLFEASQTACNDLFVRVIPAPVASEAEFDRLSLALYKVFDDRLRNDVRQPKPDKPLPAPLSEVVTLLHNGSFKYLGALRNKSAAHDQKEAAWKLVPIYEELIGARAIAPDDAKKWLELQKALLQMLFGVLRDVRRVFEAAESRSVPD
jgi:hypothetical protein